MIQLRLASQRAAGRAAGNGEAVSRGAAHAVLENCSVIVNAQCAAPSYRARSRGRMHAACRARAAPWRVAGRACCITWCVLLAGRCGGLGRGGSWLRAAVTHGRLNPAPPRRGHTDWRVRCRVASIRRCCHILLPHSAQLQPLRLSLSACPAAITQQQEACTAAAAADAQQHTKRHYIELRTPRRVQPWVPVGAAGWRVGAKCMVHMVQSASAELADSIGSDCGSSRWRNTAAAPQSTCIPPPPTHPRQNTHWSDTKRSAALLQRQLCGAQRRQARSGTCGRFSAKKGMALKSLWRGPYEQRAGWQGIMDGTRAALGRQQRSVCSTSANIIKILEKHCGRRTPAEHKLAAPHWQRQWRCAPLPANQPHNTRQGYSTSSSACRGCISDHRDIQQHRFRASHTPGPKATSQKTRRPLTLAPSACDHTLHTSRCPARQPARRAACATSVTKTDVKNNSQGGADCLPSATPTASAPRAQQNQASRRLGLHLAAARCSRHSPPPPPLPPQPPWANCGRQGPADARAS
jgi:hypothetical protein